MRWSEGRPWPLRGRVSAPNQLSAGLREGEIAEFVEHDEVEPAEQVGGASLAGAAGLGVELVDQVDDVEEPSAGAVSDAGPDDADGQVGFSRARAADQHEIALLLKERPARKVPHQGLVDRRAPEAELVAAAGGPSTGRTACPPSPLAKGIRVMVI